MRLADFILANIEPILAEWEEFARGITSAASMDQLALRDQAADILRAAVRDMTSAQTNHERSEKSRGRGDPTSDQSRALNSASHEHAIERFTSGFDIIEVVSEYRALRASVISLWTQSARTADEHDLADLTRFNESLDQSLTRAIVSFTKRVDHSREMFLAILGHDLRNPLSAIRMLGQLLSQGGQSQAQCAALAPQIVTSADVMGRMINDLLEFTRTRLGGGMPIAPQAIDLAATARAVLDEFRAAHPTREFRLSCDDELLGEWDPSRLRQALSNLVSNAIHHGEATSPIDVTLTVAGAHVLLDVANQGPPMAPGAVPRVVDKMLGGMLADIRMPRPGGHLGLGLYIVQEIVHAHGGTVEAASSADTGTVITIKLPRRCP